MLADRLPRPLLAVSRDLLVVGSIGTFLAIVRPFGAPSNLWFGYAWLYWLGLVGWGWFVGQGVFRRVSRLDLPEIAILALQSLAISAAVMPAILAFEAMRGSAVPLGYYPRLYFYVWVITAAISTIGWLIDRLDQRETAIPAPAEPPAATRSAFLDRLPAKLRAGRLLAVASEDHYLRVHTTVGSDLILMRLADAVRELAGVEGMQVHRSWWVARAAVRTIARDGARLKLTLDGGLEVPVSRTYAPKVREAGWGG